MWRRIGLCWCSAADYRRVWMDIPILSQCPLNIDSQMPVPLYLRVANDNALLDRYLFAYYIVTGMDDVYFSGFLYCRKYFIILFYFVCYIHILSLYWSSSTIIIIAVGRQFRYRATNYRFLCLTNRCTAMMDGLAVPDICRTIWAISAITVRGPVLWQNYR